jgi:hypothetical protein
MGSRTRNSQPFLQKFQSCRAVISKAARAPCPLWVKSRHMRRNKSAPAFFDRAFPHGCGATKKPGAVSAPGFSLQQEVQSLVAHSTRLDDHTATWRHNALTDQTAIHPRTRNHSNIGDGNRHPNKGRRRRPRQTGQLCTPTPCAFAGVSTAAPAIASADTARRTRFITASFFHVRRQRPSAKDGSGLLQEFKVPGTLSNAHSLSLQAKRRSKSCPLYPRKRH